MSSYGKDPDGPCTCPNDCKVTRHKSNDQPLEWWIVRMSLSKCDKAFSSYETAISYQKNSPSALDMSPVRRSIYLGSNVYSSATSKQEVSGPGPGSP